MTLGEVEQLLDQADHNGFPVIVSMESQYLVGFVLRRDLVLAIKAARARHRQHHRSGASASSNGPSSSAGQQHQQHETEALDEDRLHRDTPVLFTSHVPPGLERPPLKFAKLLDLAPTTITDKTPMETVVNMFRKLGLRQTLVTHNGRLLGIITKKDVLRHIKRMDDEDPETILFN